MMDNFNYPVGSDNSRAPWNETDKTVPLEVTCSNTLSKIFTIDVDTEREINLKEEFIDQQFSAAEALQVAVRRAKEAEKLASLMYKKYPRIAEKIFHAANVITNICGKWNEDELEVVK